MIVENKTYDEIEVGDVGRITRVVNGDDFIVFANASGNFNPAHLTDETAAGPKAAVAPSMWLGSLFSALLGNTLPGVGTLYRAQSLHFHERAHVGDTLEVSVSVVEKRPERLVILDCKMTNQKGDLICDGVAEVLAPLEKKRIDMNEVPGLVVTSHQHFDKMLERCERLDPLATAVVCPEDDASIGGALLGRNAGLILPVFVGNAKKIQAVAAKHNHDISGIEIIDIAEPVQAAARSVALVHQGGAGAIMKGYIHSDEILAQVVKREGGLRTNRRLSHVFVLDVPGLDHLLIVSDAAINIAPDLETKVDIVQNAIDLALALGIETPRVGVLSAIETVNPKMPSSMDAAILSKMAERGQIKGGIVDGPLAMDNAIDLEAARTKGIKSLVAGRADVLIAPNIEAGNMLAKELTFVAHAEAAGLVMGAKVPVMLTSRADNEKARLVSCALALLYNQWHQDGQLLKKAAE